MSEWTEGVCSDGAAILRDGQPVTISELLGHLNTADKEIERLRERLEMTHAYDATRKRVAVEPGSIPDGIDCRDETIAQLEKQLRIIRSAALDEAAFDDAISADSESGRLDPLFDAARQEIDSGNVSDATPGDKP